MKTDRNIFVEFILNLAFAIFELIGGIITGSIAVASDALHDVGDAISIGISYFLERKRCKQYDLPQPSHHWSELGQYLRHHCTGLHHGLRHRQDAELRPW